MNAVVLDLADEGSFYSLGCPWGNVDLFCLWFIGGNEGFSSQKRRNKRYVPRRSYRSFLSKREGRRYVPMVLQENEKEIHSKKRRNGRYAPEKGLVGVSFQKEKEWAVRVKWRLFRLSSFFL